MDYVEGDEGAGGERGGRSEEGGDEGEEGGDGEVLDHHLPMNGVSERWDCEEKDARR